MADVDAERKLLALGLSRENLSSIKLQRHKDGTYFHDIHLYYQDGLGDPAVAEIVRLDAALRANFNMGEIGGG